MSRTFWDKVLAVDHNFSFLLLSPTFWVPEYHYFCLLLRLKSTLKNGNRDCQNDDCWWIDDDDDNCHFHFCPNVNDDEDLAVTVNDAASCSTAYHQICLPQLPSYMVSLVSFRKFRLKFGRTFLVQTITINTLTLCPVQHLTYVVYFN